MARFPTRAQVAGKWVELKRQGGEEAGIGKILTPMLWLEKNKDLIFVMFHERSWKLKKIEAFDFCEVLSTRGHENQKKLKNLIFVRFHVTGVIKIREYWSIWFLWSFMYKGLWKLEKIEEFEYCEV